ncbi:TetR/AcrR family transcriptional regulator [Microbispora amethystogenes]|uniref:TetR family transcriptional regulator n=1 Tax=Microbispora amethystogenes TaxID=1427754 RepID=A0ABQ4FEC4_9ACTN|nr:TetR/AcrR family transcriptional regulator [Microbispora amethystogenes]GIH33156.1 TetR family transcriptional regulator [Microbispora amethystogenes]
MAAGSKPLRSDAARNRDKLLVAATQVLAERGLDAPLEHIARRAGVSIGTLYNHFPTREALLGAVLPQRMAALDEITAAALAHPDPWAGFAGFLEGLFTLQAEDHSLNEALTQSFSLATDVSQACHRGFRDVERIIERARTAGRLRADFAPTDLVTLIWAMSQVIRESMETAPDTWRRFLAFFLDGLRAEAAHPLPQGHRSADR